MYRLFNGKRLPQTDRKQNEHSSIQEIIISVDLSEKDGKDSQISLLVPLIVEIDYLTPYQMKLLFPSSQTKKRVCVHAFGALQ